jgi:hypothetical protein
MFRRAPRLPRGPFSGADVTRALEAEGWYAEAQESPEEMLVYRHPDRGTQRITVDPDWAELYEGDPVFNVLSFDLGLSSAELVDRLRPS